MREFDTDINNKVQTKTNTRKKKEHKKKTLIGQIFYWAFFLICVWGVFAGISAFSSTNTLKFAQISDVHLSDKTLDTTYKVLASSRKLFDDEISQINATPKLDFVFVTGDMTDKSREDMILEFIDKMNTLKYPWYSAFGNHDIAIDGPMTKEKYLSILREHNPNFKFKKPYYSFVPKKGFRVIAMDGVIDNTITANGKISKEQLEWLDGQLAKAKSCSEVPLIFLHFPLYEPFSSFHHRILNSDEFYAVLNKYTMPIALFSGHYHAGKITKEGHLLHVSTPALVTYPNAFRIVNVTNMKNKVIFEFEFKETNLKDIQKKAKMLTFSSKSYSGEGNDQNTTVVMDK